MHAQQTLAAQRPNIIVIVVDDWGRADLGIYGLLDDIKTPHLDRLAQAGVNFSDGYITSPQCAPSRVAILTGMNQQRFGFDNINYGPLLPDVETIADRLLGAGYRTAMIGKWHLEPNAATVLWAKRKHPELVENGRIIRLPFSYMEPYYPHHFGFQHYYTHNQSPYFANFNTGGEAVEPAMVGNDKHRVDAKTEAAVGFINAHQQSDQPYFLYLAYYAPHVPLDAPQYYLDRFPGEMPERRRHGLALMSAIDDGIGKIVETLKAGGQYENTLIFFISDNGAPLGAHQGQPMEDVLPTYKPGPAWCGSRNDPFLGEKGMLTEGGIRVPFIAAWPGTIPSGQWFTDPVISMDIAATAAAVAGLPQVPEFDGVNLIPYLTGQKHGSPHENLYWRFWSQTAIRSGDWKLIQAGKNRRLLFNLKDDPGETQNLSDRFPERAEVMYQQLEEWNQEVVNRGMPESEGNVQEVRWFRFYFDQTNEEASNQALLPLPDGWVEFMDDFSRIGSGPTTDGSDIGPGFVITSANHSRGKLQLRSESITGAGVTGLRDTVLSYQALELNPLGFAVAADLMLTVAPDRSIGVVFNFQDHQNFHKARIRQNQIQIRRTVNGQESVIHDENSIAGIELYTRYRLTVSSIKPHEFTVELQDADSGIVIWQKQVIDIEETFSGGFGGLVLSVNHADPQLDNLAIRTLR
jgi:arylsulfatase A-like enzyme